MSWGALSPLGIKSHKRNPGGTTDLMGHKTMGKIFLDYFVLSKKKVNKIPIKSVFKTLIISK